MQVARNFFLSRKKTYVRKLIEILLALRIERDLSKREILELYLNKIYMGHRGYGAGAAAQGTVADRSPRSPTLSLTAIERALQV